MTDQTFDLDENDEPRPGELIRAKWTMDGSTTLDEAAEKLDRFAAYLRDLASKGWTLAEPIADDYGVLVSPTGDTGVLDEEIEHDEG